MDFLFFCNLLWPYTIHIKLSIHGRKPQLSFLVECINYDPPVFLTHLCFFSVETIEIADIEFPAVSVCHPVS